MTLVTCLVQFSHFSFFPPKLTSDIVYGASENKVVTESFTLQHIYKASWVLYDTINMHLT